MHILCTLKEIGISGNLLPVNIQTQLFLQQDEPLDNLGNSTPCLCGIDVKDLFPDKKLGQLLQLIDYLRSHYVFILF